MHFCILTTGGFSDTLGDVHGGGAGVRLRGFAFDFSTKIA